MICTQQTNRSLLSLSEHNCNVHSEGHEVLAETEPQCITLPVSYLCVARDVSPATRQSVNKALHGVHHSIHVTTASVNSTPRQRRQAS